jgi:hypothetical protein
MSDLNKSAYCPQCGKPVRECGLAKLMYFESECYAERTSSEDQA